MRIPPVIAGIGARHGWLIAIAVAYLYLFPYFPKIQSANELPRIYLVKAIADEHTFAIDSGVKRWGSTGDVSPSGGHQYSNKAPGSSMLAAAPYFVVRAVAGEPSLATTFWIARVFTGVVPMLLFLALVFRFLERVAPDPGVRKLVLVAYALGSLAMTYSILFFSHQLAAICVASAWIFALDVVDGKRRLPTMFVAGLFVGAAPLVDYQALFAVVPVAIHVVVRMLRARWPAAQIGKAVALAAIGAAIPIAVLLGYHDACFGSPWRTGYDASKVYAHHHQAGFLGITELRWVAFAGSLWKPDNGLFTLSPWLLLAIPGGVLAWRRRELRGYVLVGASVAAIYILFISSINFWRGGWNVGPRYITAMLPFLLPLVAVCVQACARRPIVLGLATATIVVGVTIYALASATYPHWPDSFRHPLVDVTFRMLSDDLVAPSVASALGVHGVVGLVPYFVVVAGLLLWAIARAGSDRRGITIGIAAVLGAVVIVVYTFAFDHGGPAVERPYKFVKMSVVDAHS